MLKDNSAVEARFWSHVEKGASDECWIWRASRGGGMGYGRFSPGAGPQIAAHRYSYLVTFGEIPAGALICHKCDNPPCVNPTHLFAGSHADNVRDCMRKGRRAINTNGNERKTHCVKGHPLAEGNILRVGGGRWRACALCQRFTELRYKDRVESGCERPRGPDGRLLHCPNGHEYAIHEGKGRTHGAAHRTCRECIRLRKARFRARNNNNLLAIPVPEGVE